MSDEMVQVDDLMDKDSELTLEGFPEEGTVNEPEVQVEFADEETVPVIDDEKVRLQAELERASAERESLALQASQNEALASALSKINSSLDDKKEEVKEEEVPQLDLKSIIDNVDKNLVVKPGETLMSALVPIVQQLEKGSEIKTSKLEKELGKARIFQDDNLKVVYQKYSSEVEKKAKGYKGLDAYEKAIKEVRADHFDDFVADSLEAQKESLKEELMKELGGSVNEPKGREQVTFTNASTAPNRPSKAMKLKNRDELQVVKDWAFKTGGFFDLDSDPELMATAIEHCRSKGLISK